MGKSVSHKFKMDYGFRVLNIPYLDYFIFRKMGELEYSWTPLGDIKAAYKRVHKRELSAASWSQAIGRLEREGFIKTERREQLYLSFSTLAIRAQFEKVFSETKILKEMQIKLREQRKKWKYENEVM